MLDYALLPPEINSLRMYTGPGSTSLAAAATSWQTTAQGLWTALTGLASTISALSSTWIGPSSQAMQSAALQYQFWITQTAARCEQTAAQAVAAVDAYETAFAATVPPSLVAANRSLLATLVATNFLGINTPAIMATEADYAEMWAQDAAAMYAYAASSLQAMELDGFTPAPQVSSDLQQVLPAIQHTATTLPDLLSGILTPGSNQASTGLAGILNLLDGSTGSSLGTLLNSTDINSIFSSGFYMPSQSLFPFLALLQTEEQNELTKEQNQQTTAVPAGSPGVPQEPWMSAPQATMTSAGRVGGLSVPKSWGDVQLVSRVSPVTQIPQNGNDGEAGFPGIPGVPLARAMNGMQSDGALPKYGSRPTIMLRPPSGG